MIKKGLIKIKQIPKWGWFFGLFYFLFSSSMYVLGNVFAKLLKIDAHLVKIPIIDDHIKIIPIFIIIYIFSYLFWFFSHLIITITSKKNFINYVVGLTLAYLIGFLILIFFPTYMNRDSEGLILLANSKGFLNSIFKLIYFFDGNTLAYNLFPSFHCLASVYCYLGVRRQPEISKNFQIYSLIMAILICFSTLFTKQHYIIDVIGGIGISILCYLLVNIINPGKKYVNATKNRQKEA